MALLRRLTTTTLLASALALPGCMTSSSGSSYGGAAAALGAGIVTAGVLRAATGSCWAQCSPGYRCNHDSGLCEPGTCHPACSVSENCAQTMDGRFLCSPK